ncbi:MAG: DUF167 domain-containing protein [Patescibacteria group bacterium]|nr:DUF167 domain-containing protein [Patescibacteria group bacterium]
MLSKFKDHLRKNNELYLKIKVCPGAVKTAIREIIGDETIKIDIAAPPIKGRANQELVKFLADEFAIEKNNVKIISGERKRVKLIKLINH